MGGRTPAHTIKIFGVVMRRPAGGISALTLRPTINCLRELLWIWQRKSNNIKDLKGHMGQWADEDGSIGKAYGYQTGKYRFSGARWTRWITCCGSLKTRLTPGVSYKYI
ncbi:MAG: thymidylate synthase [Anaerovoracaceae bacterium]